MSMKVHFPEFSVKIESKIKCFFLICPNLWSETKANLMRMIQAEFSKFLKLVIFDKKFRISLESVFFQLIVIRNSPIY